MGLVTSSVEYFRLPVACPVDGSRGATTPKGNPYTLICSAVPSPPWIVLLLWSFAVKFPIWNVGQSDAASAWVVVAAWTIAADCAAITTTRPAATAASPVAVLRILFLMGFLLPFACACVSGPLTAPAPSMTVRSRRRRGGSA